jgi:nucleoside-diphosphate-sugar epimerase
VGVVVNVGGAPEADGSRAKAWLGFEPRTTIDQGLDRTADWLAGHERKA